jgi:ABC-2 type transport system permease protein
VRLIEGDRWWPLAISLVVALVVLLSAAWFTTRRDIGSGVLPPRPGPAEAHASLGSPLGLAWRLQRGTVLAWAVGMALLGAVFGSVSNEMEAMVRDNPTLQQYLERAGGSITDALFATALLFTGLGAGAFAVASALRVRGEEAAGRLEPVLATATSRPRALLHPLVVTLLGTLVVVTAGGLGTAVADALVRGSTDALVRLTALAWVQIPAVLVLVGLAVLLTGWLPRATALIWALMGLAFVVGWLGGLLSLPDWLRGLSPYEHLPQVPIEEVAVAPLVTLTLVAVALVVAGTVGFRRRDIA